MDKHLLIFGHGYTAGALTPRMVARGWRVTGTTRQASRLAQIAALGADPLLWDGGVCAALETATHVLVSAAPGPEGDPVLTTLAADLSAARRLERLVYLSTTGVYGDHGGAWVDEETPCDPTSRRAQARIQAENAWIRQAARLTVPLDVLRLAGIYGPGRGPFAKLRNGTARRIIKPNQVFSRIHVEDAARAAEAALIRSAPGQIYNICDDEPLPPQDIMTMAAELLGVSPPPEVDFETADMSPMARSFYGDSKRVRNARMKRDLGVTLAHPTARAGLEAILRAETGA